MDHELAFKDEVGLSPAVQKAAPRPPWHLAFVGGAALLWSLLSVFDFMATITRFSPYMNQLPELTREFIYATPYWVLAVRAVAVFASLVGAVLLLRKRLSAVRMLMLSAAATFLSVALSFNGPVPDDAIPVFGVCVVVVSMLLLYYAQTWARRGVLR